MDKLVFSNSDINKEAIREKYLFGSNQGVTMEITQRSLWIAINNQYWLYLRNKSNMISKQFDRGFACDGTLYICVDNFMVST